MSGIDVQRVVTDRIIAAIENGGLSSWVKPWVNLGLKDSAIPYNFLTKSRYKGCNALYFALCAIEAGFEHNAWLTFNQAKQLGGMVRKGEKGIVGVKYVSPTMRKDTSDSNPGAPESLAERNQLFPVAFHVFNVEQIDGLELPVKATVEPMPIDEKILAVEQLVKRQQVESNLGYKRSGDGASYSPALDLIKMPEGPFHTSEHYAATLAHELIHATGHSKRLERFKANDARFKDQRSSYAFEELVAEIGAAFVCAELGIVGDHLQHESYIDHWLSELKRDKRLIFSAASLASAAHHHLMGYAEVDAQTLQAAA